MNLRLLWIGSLAQSLHLILCAPASAQAIAEPDIVGTPWTGETGVQATTAQLMAREKQLAGAQHANIPRPRPRAARQTLLPDPDFTPPARGLPSGPLAGNPAPPASPISPDSQTVGFSFTAATL